MVKLLLSEFFVGLILESSFGYVLHDILGNSDKVYIIK
jgi:hypothetical protein